MKKFFVSLLIAIISLSANYYAYAGENALPANDMAMPVYNEPVKLDDDAFDSPSAAELKTFSSDETPDWLKNTNLPTLDHLKKSGLPDSYADSYMRMYKALYLFSTSSSSRLLNYSDRNYLLVDISADISPSELSDDSLLKSGEQQKYFDFYDISHVLIDDNPQFYFVANYRSIFYSNSRVCVGIEISDDYIDPADRLAQNDIITNVVAQYDEAVSGLDSNYLIEKAVHDKIIIDNNYEKDENGNPADSDYAHSIIGIIDPGHTGAVCEGYSRAFLFFMNRYKVPCFYTAGNTSLGYHAWNLVQLDDGEYHCLDCTWDDNYFNSSPIIYFLYYKYFNKPYTDFYINSGRDDSLRKITGCLPELSDNTNFYNTIYDGSNYLNQPYTSDGKGGRIYPAPTVTYQKARIYPAETDVNTQAFEITEYTGEFTPYTGYDGIITSGKDFIKLSRDTANWKYASFTSGKRLLMAESDAAVSFLTEYNMQLTFSAYLPDGQLDIYIDGQKFKQLGASSYLQQEGIPLPCGRHKVTLQYSGTYLQFYDVSAKPRADIDANGSIDILDAIAFANIKTISYTSDNTEYLSYDLDDNSIVDDDDLKIILKEAIKAAA